MRKPDDDPVILAKVIDLEQARVRRDEGGRSCEDSSGQPASEPDPELIRVQGDRMRQMERTARKRRRLLERTAGQRAAASRYRIQVRVADRLARIEAELEAEIARLRLAYAQGRSNARSDLWMWPTAAASLLILVAGLAYFAGTQQPHALPVGVVSSPIASKPVASSPIASKPVASKPVPQQPDVHVQVIGAQAPRRHPIDR